MTICEKNLALENLRNISNPLGNNNVITINHILDREAYAFFQERKLLAKENNNSLNNQKLKNTYIDFNVNINKILATANNQNIINKNLNLRSGNLSPNKGDFCNFTAYNKFRSEKFMKSFYEASKNENLMNISKNDCSENKNLEQSANKNNLYESSNNYIQKYHSFFKNKQKKGKTPDSKNIYCLSKKLTVKTHDSPETEKFLKEIGNYNAQTQQASDYLKNNNEQSTDYFEIPKFHAASLGVKYNKNNNSDAGIKGNPVERISHTGSKGFHDLIKSAVKSEKLNDNDSSSKFKFFFKFFISCKKLI